MFRDQSLSLGPSDASILLYIDEADLAKGSLQPVWEIGDVPIAERHGGGSSGTVIFELTRNVDAAASPGTPGSPGWPVTLAGEMSWTCRPW